MNTRILWTIIMIFELFTTAYAQQVDQAKLDLFFDFLADHNKAMGSLAIVKHGKVIYDRAIGFSQLSDNGNKTLTAANRFRIGSITKMFTATMILQLVDEGKLKLSDPLNRFLPQIPNAEKITIRQILNHRSGIPNITRDQNAQGNVKTLPMTKQEHLAMIVNTAPDFEPDSRTQYSNSGYFVLGLIIEQLAGNPYETVLQEKIASKIGLKNTYLATGNIDVNKLESLTYFLVPGGDWKPVPETHPSILFSAGAIVSTPYDLAAFIRALFNDKLLSKESLKQMITMKDGEGMGMVTFDFAGRMFYGHTGGADNYGAWLSYLPAEDLAIAYTTNAKVYPVKDILNGVVDIYYNKSFTVPDFEAIALRPEVLDQYIGTYALVGAPTKFIITRQETTLYAKAAGGQNAFPLEATGQHTFKVDNGSPSGILFEFDIAKGQMKIKRDGGERVFTKEQ